MKHVAKMNLNAIYREYKNPFESLLNLDKMALKAPNSKRIGKNSAKNSLNTSEAFDADLPHPWNDSNAAPVVPLIGQFAKLKYGENKELIFNINCRVRVRLGDPTLSHMCLNI
jgi:hypothetical protein